MSRNPGDQSNLGQVGQSGFQNPQLLAQNQLSLLDGPGDEVPPVYGPKLGHHITVQGGLVAQGTAIPTDLAQFDPNKAETTIQLQPFQPKLPEITDGTPGTSAESANRANRHEWHPRH